ncbi:MAG: transposase family protein [Magnetospirillum sp.]|nr:transposase family protein [Magnetospirillum sp.]
MGHQQTIRRGMFAVSKDSIWEIKGTDTVKKAWKLENYNTGAWKFMTLTELEEECFNGTIEIREQPHDVVPEMRRELQKVQLSDLPPHMRYSADRKGFFVVAFKDPQLFYKTYLPNVPAAERLLPRHKTKRELVPFAKVVQQAFVANFRDHYAQLFSGKFPKGFDKTPAFSTYCSWVTLFEKVGGDQRCLASRYDLRGSETKARHMSAKVEEWLHNAIDDVWLTEEQRPKSKVYLLLKAKVDDWNKENPGWQLKCPSERHVRRYIDQIVNKFTAAVRRKGIDAAQREFGQYGQGPEASDILEVVEVDHTRADVYVIDERTERVIGRPWVTVLLCRYSRIPVGIHVHFDGPSVNAVMQCLRNAMSPKGFLKDLGVDYRYPHGRPVILFADRGAEFLSNHLRAAAQQFNFRLDFEPVACPEYKGAIERWWRTLNEEVAHGLPGSVSRKKELRQTDGKGYITFGAFCRRLWLWVATDYVKRVHRGIDDIPLRRWQEAESSRGARIPPREEDMKILLNRVEQLVPSKKGVQWSHLRWVGETLTEIMSHKDYQKGRKVEVKIDETDLSKAWVVNPFTGKSAPLKPVMKKYMTGLTLFQHRLCEQIKKERNLAYYDEASHLAAKAALFEEEQRLQRAKGTRKTARAGMARFNGIGKCAPAGNDLGDLAAPASGDEAPEPQTVTKAPGLPTAPQSGACAQASEPELEQTPVKAPKRKTIRKS